MKQLSELIGLLDREQTLFSAPATGEDRPVQQLYDFLRATEDPTDEAAAEALAMEPTTPAFRKIKHRLKLELINALTAISVSGRESDRRERALAYVYKVTAIGQQVRASRSAGPLLPYLQEAFRLAERYEEIESAQQLAVMLRRQFVNRFFDRAKYAYYAEQAVYYGTLADAYNALVADLNEVTYLRNIRATPEEIRDAARGAHLRHAPLLQRYDLVMIGYLVFLLEVNQYLATSDYGRVIDTAQRALSYLRTKPNALPRMYEVFEANLTVAYAQMNDYPRGTAFARQLLERTAPGDHNYIKVYELLLTLSLRAGRFQEAYASYRSIQPETFTTDLIAYYSESFRIIEAYLYLLVEMGQIKLDPEDQTFARFRIKRFVNSFEHATGEKRHRNVHLLIIQIIDHVVHRRHTKSTYTIEAITKYATRHLRGHDYRRVRYFLKALAQLSTQQFHRAAVERHTARYIQQLQELPLNESRLDYSMELVPYEVLWNLILEQLGYKRIRRSRGTS